MKTNIATMSSCVQQSSYVNKTQVQTLLSALFPIHYFHGVNWAVRIDSLPVTISLVGIESPYMAEDSQPLILRTLSSLGSLFQQLPTATGRFSGQGREQHTYIDKNHKCLEGNLTGMIIYQNHSRFLLWGLWPLVALIFSACFQYQTCISSHGVSFKYYQEIPL